MATYRYKATTVEAEQYKGVNGPTPDGVCMRLGEGHPDRPHVHTPSRAHPIFPGDWVVTHANGNRDVVGAEQFAGLWEPNEQCPGDCRRPAPRVPRA